MLGSKHKDNYWETKDILDRGIRILEFMEKRWGLKFEKDKEDSMEIEFENFHTDGWMTPSIINNKHQGKIRILNLNNIYGKLYRGYKNMPIEKNNGSTQSMNLFEEE